MNAVSCYDARGNAVSVPADAFIFRPAVFGILIDQGQVLLLRHPQTGLWHPPGGILTLSETPTQAVRHHLQREAGVMPILGPLLFVEERYRLDDQGQAWHLSVLYYALERPAAGAAIVAKSDGTAQPVMISLEELQRDQMQFGYDAIQAGRLRLGL
jgi:ADP-ribose pyrophosphatase YjhB (NUDIX family)